MPKDDEPEGKHVFISYAHKDRFFAGLLEENLKKEEIDVWRDLSSLKIGASWQTSIDRGISESSIIIVVISAASMNSQYVTYEWSFALGKFITILPVLIEKCDIHPKLATIQYFDFTGEAAYLWKSLLNEIKDRISDQESAETPEYERNTPEFEQSERELLLQNKITSYLNEKGFRMISFERVLKSVDTSSNEEEITKLVAKSPIFRSARLKGGKNGLAIL